MIAHQAGLSPACTVVGGKKDATRNPGKSPGKEIRARHRKSIDISERRQPRVDRSPACAVVGGKKDTGFISSGKKIRARHRKSIDRSERRQPRVDRSPACTDVGRKKNATVASPCKEIRTRNGEYINRILQAGTCCSPASAVVGGKIDAAKSLGKEIRAGDGKSIDKCVRCWQPRVDRSPACAVVGGKKNAAISPGKEIRPAYSEAIDITPIRSIGLHPLGI